MSKGWKYESGRHACAARGIPTKPIVHRYGNRTVYDYTGHGNIPRKIVEIKLQNGYITVKNLPSGWNYIVYDLNNTDHPELILKGFNRTPDKNVMKILVEGNTINEVKNPPNGIASWITKNKMIRKR